MVGQRCIQVAQVSVQVEQANAPVDRLTVMDVPVIAVVIAVADQVRAADNSAIARRRPGERPSRPSFRGGRNDQHSGGRSDDRMSERSGGSQPFSSRRDLNNDLENVNDPAVIDLLVIDRADVPAANAAGNMVSGSGRPGGRFGKPGGGSRTPGRFPARRPPMGQGIFQDAEREELRKASVMNQVQVQVAVQVEADQDAVDQAVEMRVEEMQAVAASRGSSHRADRPKEAHEVQVDDRSEEVAVRRSTNVREIVTEVATETAWAAEITVANAEVETLVAIAPSGSRFGGGRPSGGRPGGSRPGGRPGGEADLEDDPVVVGLADVFGGRDGGGPGRNK